MTEEKKVTSEEALKAVNTLRSYCNNWKECSRNCLFHPGDEDEECSLTVRTPNCWYEDFVLTNKEGLLRHKIIEVLQGDYWPVQAADRIMEKVKEVYGDKLDN